MIRRPPRFTRTDTLFPYTTLLRSRVAAICQAVTKRPEQPFWRFTPFSYRSARSQHGAFPLGRIDTADPNSRTTLSLHAKLLRSGARQVDHPTTDKGTPRVYPNQNRREERRDGQGVVLTGRLGWPPVP